MNVRVYFWTLGFTHLCVCASVAPLWLLCLCRQSCAVCAYQWRMVMKPQDPTQQRGSGRNWWVMDLSLTCIVGGPVITVCSDSTWAVDSLEEAYWWAQLDLTVTPVCFFRLSLSFQRPASDIGLTLDSLACVSNRSFSHFILRHPASPRDAACWLWCRLSTRPDPPSLSGSLWSTRLS